MTTIKKEETEKKPRFQVLENGEVVLNAAKKELANDRIQELQDKLKPVIILLDHKEKKSIRYRKTIHQRNYRIEFGDYEMDQAIPPVAESEPKE